MYNYFNILSSVDVCKTPEGEQIIGVLGNILIFIKIAIPIILIIIGMISLIKAMISNEKDAIKKATSSLVKKAGIAVVIFFIPTIVNFIMSMIGQGDNACVANLLSPNKYAQRVLEEKIDTAQELLKEGQILKINDKEYTVKEGDTIESISKENNISEKDLIDNNNLTSSFTTCPLLELTLEENCDIMECEANNKCTQIDGIWYCCTEGLKGVSE